MMKVSSGTDLKLRFYEHLQTFAGNEQIFVVENTDPPEHFLERATQFTGARGPLPPSSADAGGAAFRDRGLAAFSSGALRSRIPFQMRLTVVVSTPTSIH